jgi:hypothetical protein
MIGRMFPPQGYGVEDEPYSYVIFTDDDGYIKAKNGKTGRIDFSGTDASTVIQSAINAISSGKILIKRGKYIIKSPITIDKSGIVIEGETKETVTSILQADESLVDCIIRFGSTYKRIGYCGLKNIYISGGNRVPSINGVHIQRSDVMLIEDVIIKEVKGCALLVESTWNSEIRNLFIENCGDSNTSKPSVYLKRYDVDNTAVDGLKIYNLCIGLMNYYGLYAEYANNVMLFGGVLSNEQNPPDYHCFYLKNCNFFKISDYTIEWVGINNNTFGIFISYCNDVTVKGVSIHYGYGNYIKGGGGIRVDGSRARIIACDIFGVSGNCIDVWGTSDVKVIACYGKDGYKGFSCYSTVASLEVIGNTFLYPSSGVSIYTASTKSLILNNIVDAIIDAVPGAVVRRNIGYTTEKSGVATIPANSTSVTVLHGLASAPSKVLITPLGMPAGKLWVTNITSTSFDIVTDTAPTTDLNIAWYAEI